MSNSANSGGKIGWVDEENLSEIITKELKNIKLDNLQMLFKLEIIF